MQTQDNTRCVIEEETENSTKNLSAILQVEIDLLENKVGLHE